MDAVLRDSAEYLRTIDEAIGQQDPQSELVAFYSVDSAYAGSVEWINGFVEDGTTVTGTVRYFDRKVTFEADGSASLTYCADEFGARERVLPAVSRTPGCPPQYGATG